MNVISTRNFNSVTLAILLWRFQSVIVVERLTQTYHKTLSSTAAEIRMTFDVYNAVCIFSAILLWAYTYDRTTSGIRDRFHHKVWRPPWMQNCVQRKRIERRDHATPPRLKDTSPHENEPDVFDNDHRHLNDPIVTLALDLDVFCASIGDPTAMTLVLSKAFMLMNGAFLRMSLVSYDEAIGIEDSIARLKRCEFKVEAVSSRATAMARGYEANSRPFQISHE